jgi:hypothetical protein
MLWQGDIAMENFCAMSLKEGRLWGTETWNEPGGIGKAENPMEELGISGPRRE